MSFDPEAPHDPMPTDVKLAFDQLTDYEAARNAIAAAFDVQVFHGTYDHEEAAAVAAYALTKELEFHRG